MNKAEVREQLDRALMGELAEQWDPATWGTTAEAQAALDRSMQI